MHSKNAYIIGAGLAGSVIANRLSNNGYNVDVVERRKHIAGNAYDYKDVYGININKYGPHIFHTNNDRVYNFINQFGEFKEFNLVCGSVIDGKCIKTAFDFESIDIFFPNEAAEIKNHIKNVFKNAKSASILDLLDCDDALIKKYANFLYTKDYAPYTAKQWGIDINEIDKQVFKKVPILFSYGGKYFSDKYQVMPVEGYTNVIKKMLENKNINILLNIDALKDIKFINDELFINDRNDYDVIIYTGAIDELFNLHFGALPYRSLRFDIKHENIDSFQDMPVVAYPQNNSFTRITEYKKLPVQNVNGTTYAIEYPLHYDKNMKLEPYYPILTDESKEIYTKYFELAKRYKKLYLCGRLAEFKYYDMDEVINRALELSDRILGEKFEK